MTIEQHIRDLYGKTFGEEVQKIKTKQENTEPYYDHGEWFCQKCGHQLINTDTRCPGCKRKIDWRD